MSRTYYPFTDDSPSPMARRLSYCIISRKGRLVFNDAYLITPNNNLTYLWSTSLYFVRTFKGY